MERLQLLNESEAADMALAIDTPTGEGADGF
jgi:hypothetical protein